MSGPRKQFLAPFLLLDVTSHILQWHEQTYVKSTNMVKNTKRSLSFDYFLINSSCCKMFQSPQSSVIVTIVFPPRSFISSNFNISNYIIRQREHKKRAYNHSMCIFLKSKSNIQEENRWNNFGLLLSSLIKYKHTFMIFSQSLKMDIKWNWSCHLMDIPIFWLRRI
jgi:hypothetical protein